MPDLEMLFVQDATLTTNTFTASGSINVFAKPSALTNPVAFGIGSFDETLATGGWSKGAGNVYTYARPAGFAGAVQSMTLDFDKGTWSIKGSGADLRFLAINPTTDFRIEIGEFAGSYTARLRLSKSKYVY